MLLHLSINLYRVLHNVICLRKREYFMKKQIVLLFLLLPSDGAYADCTRADRHHVDTSIVRCLYTQEDIYNSYSQKPSCHNCEQRRKECFFCKCPIAEHTKQEAPEKCTKFGCKKGPFDDEIQESRRMKNKRGR